jgi:hypothetical protein
MKRFAIFRKGKHTASSGMTAEYTAEQLRAAVAAYDPKVSPAPIVVGHPKDNHPAFGWIGGLEFDEGTGEVIAVPEQVMPEFAEAVEAGRYRTRSASWYLPGSASHPLKGTDKHDTLYPRHVGFLGAQPPAIKGLGDVQFSDSDAGVVEFADSARWAWGSLAVLMRGFREWLIGEKGLETADKVLPNFYLSDLDAAAKEAREVNDSTAAAPAFSEEDPMTIAELQAQVAALTAERDALKAKQMPADFAERESAIAAREAKVAEAEAKAARLTVEARVDAAIKDGRALPAQRKQLVEFAMSLAEADAVVEFGEGDKAKKVTQREAYLLQVESGPKVVDYSERSGDTGANGDGRPTEAQAQEALRKQVFNAGAVKA